MSIGCTHCGERPHIIVLSAEGTRQEDGTRKAWGEVRMNKLEVRCKVPVEFIN